MIKSTKIGTLIGTGEPVYQFDVGSGRIFKTDAGKVVPIQEVVFTDGPVKPVSENTIPQAQQTPEEDARSAATVEIMEEANRDLLGD